MSDFPVDHLSASSITTFLRCPRQWQEQYVFGIKGPSNSSLIIGSTVHAYLAEVLMGKTPIFDDIYLAEIEEAGGMDAIDWKVGFMTASEIAQAHIYHYYETVGKYLSVVNTEQEVSIDFGADIPLIGFIDIECTNRIIDVKTTGYFNRKVSLNPEWKLQGRIYQLHKNFPAEFHVLTRSKKDPVVVPSSTASELYIPPTDPDKTRLYVRQIYGTMLDYWARFGSEVEYPGNVTHPWAEKYCPVERCCQR